jgi:CheY-like chemotaxis protein
LDTLEMLKVILQNRGAEVVTASSGRDALEALEHSLPDALVSDLAMPGQDGYELIERIRQRGPERGGNIPAVALTAYARVEDRVRALTAGFQIYVPKPVDSNELVAVSQPDARPALTGTAYHLAAIQKTTKRPINHDTRLLGVDHDMRLYCFSAS